ncbi:acyltransferase [Phenylobacterium sp. LjRoot225]|uniref:acyltransferase family protein n=1 Tax=Phenylobacterium sp. LjRoot225 TaxID=3342285 RepID=UPI003ECC2D65
MDGLRGVAALCVVLVHIPTLGGKSTQWEGSHAAVDLFFMISGFVLAHAYDRRFATGYSIRQFVVDRLIRLYPLYILGLGLGVLTLLVRPLPIGRAAESVAFGLAFLPVPHRGHLYPLNFPMWSLVYELAANIMFAVGWRFLRGRWLVALVASAAVGIIAYVLLRGGAATGSMWSGAIIATLRVIFGFFTGVLLYRHAPRPAQRESVAAPVLLGAVVVFLFALPSPIRTEMATRVRDLLLLGILPILVYVGARFAPGRGVRTIVVLSGVASYAIYAIHVPLSVLVRAAIPFNPSPTVAVSFLVVVTALALVVDKVFDLPARAWLKRLQRAHGSVLVAGRSAAPPSPAPERP